MDLNILVMSLIPVLLTFFNMMFTCTQRNLVIQIPAYTVNTRILISDNCILFWAGSCDILCFTHNPRAFRNLRKTSPLGGLALLNT